MWCDEDEFHKHRMRREGEREQVRHDLVNDNRPSDMKLPTTRCPSHIVGRTKLV